MDLSTGDYFALLDSDDEWLPEHLKECMEALKSATNAVMVFCATASST